VCAGTVIDSLGKTAGDCDVILRNPFWFPIAKPPVVQGVRRKFYPVESIYSILEVKQTLTESALDDAMKKLVMAKRLLRPVVSADYLSENRRSGITNLPYPANPLQVGIIATKRSDGFSEDEMVKRFIRINQQLKRREMCSFLTIIGDCTYAWAYPDSEGLSTATFLGDDLRSELRLTRFPAEDNQTPFFFTVSFLLHHIATTILSPESIEVAYGIAPNTVTAIRDPRLVINAPDDEFTDAPPSVIDQYREYHQ